MGFIRNTLCLFVVTIVSSSVYAAVLNHEQRTTLAVFNLAENKPVEAIYWAQGIPDAAARLTKAKALMQTGRTPVATKLLLQIAETDAQLGEAWLLLAEASARAGDSQQAAHYLDKAARFSQGSLLEQVLYERAELYRMEGHMDSAGKVLASMASGYWAALGYFNFAMSYAQTDRDPVRALVALRVALAMVAADSDVERADDLREKILLRAGYHSYQNKEFNKATSFLEKISLNSYLTPQALYYHGLSLAARNNYRGAMQSWHRAKKFPLAYPGVADAWMGMARGYDELGYLGQAGEAYLAANSAFEGERVTLKTLADEVRKKSAYPALVLNARNSDLEWFLADSRVLAQPRMAYLLLFLERAEAQEAVARMADLASLKRQLEAADQDLRVFDREVAATLTRLGSKNVAAVAGRKQALEFQASQLQERIATLQVGAGDPRLKVLEDSVLAVASGLATLDVRIKSAPVQLQAMAMRITQYRKSIAGLQARVSRLEQAASVQLDTLLLAFIQEQDASVLTELDRTEQQIAHLYEHLALKHVGRARK